MGSWGVYPKDSDFCLDLKSDIDEAVNQALEVLYEEYDNNTDNGLKLNNKFALAGVVMISLQEGHFIKRKFVEKARDAIDLCIKNVKGMSWKNPKEFINKNRYILQGFNYLLNDRKEIIKKNNRNTPRNSNKKKLNLKRAGTILAPRGWLSRKFEREIGSSWSGLVEILGW